MNGLFGKAAENGLFGKAAENGLFGKAAENGLLVQRLSVLSLPRTICFA